jgi:hypothetical protein
MLVGAVAISALFNVVLAFQSGALSFLLLWTANGCVRAGKADEAKGEEEEEEVSLYPRPAGLSKVSGGPQSPL